jgi:murein DD-endopeptidase MepM/ murein hydrolase activator NlpD
MIKRTERQTINATAHPYTFQRKRIYWGEKLTRNVLVASLLLCALVGTRNIAISPEMPVLTAVQNAVESEWDENLGRLVYVNSSLSDAIAVFSSNRSVHLPNPCSGKVIGTYAASTPYILYQNAGPIVAVADGEVLSRTNSAEDTYSVRIRSANGIEYLYHGLKSCIVYEGDSIVAGVSIGDCADGELCFEMRKNGSNIDPSAYFVSAQRQ